MVRRSPCEFYLKFLLVHPDNYTDDNIRNLCKLQQLDFLGMPYLERLRRSLQVPLPFYPDDPAHLRSQKFLTKERIWGLFYPDEDMLAAQAAVDKPRVKEALEAMLITLAAPEYIAATLKVRTGTSLTPRAVSLFKHFYFNLDLVYATEVRALIVARIDAEGHKDVDENRIGTAMVSASKSDARKLISKIASPPLATLMDSLYMGYLPSGLEIGRIAAATRAVAAIQCHSVSLHGYAEQARDFALVVKVMTEVMDSVGDASTDLRADLTQMLLETEHGSVPQFDQLPKIEKAPAGILEAKGETVGHH